MQLRLLDFADFFVWLFLASFPHRVTKTFQLRQGGLVFGWEAFFGSSSSLEFKEPTSTDGYVPKVFSLSANRGLPKIKTSLRRKSASRSGRREVPNSMDQQPCKMIHGGVLVSSEESRSHIHLPPDHLVAPPSDWQNYVGGTDFFPTRRIRRDARFRTFPDGALMSGFLSSVAVSAARKSPSRIPAHHRDDQRGFGRSSATRDSLITVRPESPALASRC